MAHSGDRRSEVFLVIGGFSKHGSQLLARMDQLKFLGPSATGLYRADKDVAMLALNCSTDATALLEMKALYKFAERQSLDVLDPSMLGHEDRVRFYSHYLSNYTLRCPLQSSMRDALEALSSLVLEPQGQARGKAKTRTYQQNRHETIPAAPRARQQDPVRSNQGGNQARGTGPRDAITDCNVPVLRLLIGQRWYSARLRKLSLEEALVASSASPRPGDLVHVELRVLNQCTRLESRCQSTSSRSGMDTIRLKFDREQKENDRAVRDFLVFAKRMGVELDAPPRRSDSRLALTWPIRLGRTLIHGQARDISRGGMFVSPESPLEGRIDFSLYDDSEAYPICGTADIVREVRSEEALRLKLTAGYGLQIVKLVAGDKKRYQAFVNRVAKRARYHVVVAGDEVSTRSMCEGLVAAGYSANRSWNPHTLSWMANQRPPDAMIVDPTFVNRHASGGWLKDVLSIRNVPCVTADAQNAAKTLAAVDEMLGVN